MSAPIRRFAVFGLTTMLVAASLAAIARDGKHGSIPWVSSLEKGKKLAAKQKKPIMADFYAEWCPPCKAMKSSTWTEKAVIERAKRFVPVLVDIDKQRKQTDAAKVTAVPTIVFYDAQGRELLRAEGYVDGKGMLDLMGKAERKAKG